MIPVYNRLDMLAASVESIERCSGPRLGRIIFADDCSTEGGVADFCRQHGRYVKLRQRGGFAAAVNEGAAAASTPVFALYNSDVTASDGWLDALAAVTDRDPKVGVVGPLLLFPEDSNGDPVRPAGKVQSAGFAINAVGVPFHRLLGWDADHPKVRQFRDDLQGITGAVWLVRKHVWLSVGGMERGFVCYYEDADFCVRAKAAGWKIAYEPAAVLHHYTGASTTAGLPQSEMQRLMQVNAQMFLSRAVGKVKYDEHRML